VRRRKLLRWRLLPFHLSPFYPSPALLKRPPTGGLFNRGDWIASTHLADCLRFAPAGAGSSKESIANAASRHSPGCAVRPT